MKKKIVSQPKKQAARFDKPPVYEETRIIPPNEFPQPETILNETESAADFEAAEEEQSVKEKEKKTTEAKTDVRVNLVGESKPPLGKGQKYFETVDGRFLVGPEDAGSIEDPLNPGHEVNPWRGPSAQLHKR